MVKAVMSWKFLKSQNISTNICCLQKKKELFLSSLMQKTLSQNETRKGLNLIFFFIISDDDSQQSHHGVLLLHSSHDHTHHTLEL